MKKITKLVALLTTGLPMSLFAHPGHEHTGTFWENVIHFMVSNSYLFVIVFVAGYLLFRKRKVANRVKQIAN